MLRTKRNKVTAAILMVVLLMTFSLSALANSGSNSGTIKSNGNTLTHTETYFGTLQLFQARVSCPGARNAQVTMNAYYSTKAGGGTVTAAAGNPYVSYVEPGTAAGVSYRPQSGTYCYSATATYYVDNASVWSNGFLGYR